MIEFFTIKIYKDKKFFSLLVKQKKVQPTDCTFLISI
jgi:hypothetical protein